MIPVLRVDLVYLFLAAVVTVFLIKLTSLLPASLYFNFSSSFSDDIGSFLVPRPVLEARQHCELARAKGFTFRDCPEESTLDVFGETERKLLAQAVIEVQAGLSRDGAVAIDTLPQPADIAELTADVEQDLRSRDSLVDYREMRVRGLAMSATSPLTQAITDRLNELDPDTTEPEFVGEEEEPLDDGGEAAETDPFGSPAPEPEDTPLGAAARRLAAAENSLRSDYTAATPLVIPAATLAEIEAAIAGKTSVWAAVDAVDNLFVRRIANAIREPFDGKVRAQNIDIEGTRADVERAVLAQTGWQYALALVIRLATPFTAAALLAFAAGSGMRLSVAVGCAFSAFLLAWPVVLLWDGVVEGPYRELRGIFITFYVAYVASFFTLGWLGTTVGAILHEYWQIPYARQIDESPRLAGINVLARQIPFQVVINLATNGVTLGLSFVFFGGDIGYVR